MASDFQNILIFRIGQLGDSLVSIPAIRAVREYFPEARFTVLSDDHRDSNWITPSMLLTELGLVDDAVSYPVEAPASLGKARKLLSMLKLSLKLRAGHFDALVYLAPSRRTPEQVARDLKFFRLCGISRFYGEQGFAPLPARTPDQPPMRLAHEADHLLARLGRSGMPVPYTGEADMEFNVPSRSGRVGEWLANQPSDGGRPWIALGPGSKMPAKIWPADRYFTVVQHLIDEFDVWPVIFGGPDEREASLELTRRWGRGYVAAGELLPPDSIYAMRRRAILYLGNDTGTMHMAVAAGLKCVAVFSSRDWPGKWFPYGSGHVVLRTPIECEGCGLSVCTDRGMKCILSIGVEEVLAACRAKIRQALPACSCA